MKEKLLSIVISAYNEGQTVPVILDKIKKVQLIGGFSREIIIIDDGSTDNIRETIRFYLEQNNDLPLRLISHPVNTGKGSALHTGILNAEGEFLLVQDADPEYDPPEYNILLGPVVDGYADVDYGTRFNGGKAHRVMFFWHTIGNRFLTFLSNMFTNLNLTDMETGYKLFRMPALRQLNLREQRFGFEPEVTAKISRVPGIRVYEVGISYYGRTFQEGKKIRWKDGVRALFCILKYNIFNR